jgi:hypothetical protein
MMPQSATLSRPAFLYSDVEAAILEQEAADPDWHFGFNIGRAERLVATTPTAMAAYLSSGTLAEAQSFAGLMLRRWLRSHDARRAQFWRDVAGALARTAESRSTAA